MARKQHGFLSTCDEEKAVQIGPDRRQVLTSVSALMLRTALPAVTGVAIYAARPGGWILSESDLDVS